MNHLWKAVPQTGKKRNKEVEVGGNNTAFQKQNKLT